MFFGSAKSHFVSVYSSLYSLITHSQEVHISGFYFIADRMLRRAPASALIGTRSYFLTAETQSVSGMT